MQKAALKRSNAPRRMEGEEGKRTQEHLEHKVLIGPFVQAYEPLVRGRRMTGCPLRKRESLLLVACAPSKKALEEAK